MSGWLTQQLDNDDVHVVPLGDVIVHAFTDDCICGPTAEAVATVDGNNGHIGWMITHHSLDGREHTENP